MVAIRRALTWHRPLVAFTVAMVVLTPTTAVTWLLDDRTLLGAPIWAKPLKFAISFAAYSATLAWMLHQLRRGTRLHRSGWWTGTVIALASAVEMVIIVGQAYRGTRSHFNADTAFDAALFSLMGATVAVIYLATLAVAVLLLRTQGGDPVVASSVRLGVFVSLLGMSVGFLLVGQGGHSVGVPDGGPGLPLTGWSTTGGDLRIGHFVGMHALQVLPLLGVLLTGRRAQRLGTGARAGILRVVAAAYAGLVVLVTWQALRAQPLLAPDVTTVVAVTGLVVVTAAALAAVVRRRPALVGAVFV